MTWSEKLEESGGATGSIAFENVSFQFAGTSGPPVLKNISFACTPGETVGIIGSTGSGKSRLVGLIPRFYDADKGQVWVNGMQVKDVDPKELRESIAIVPQQSVLFSGTILDNIQMGKEDATMEEVQHAAKMAQAHDFISQLPEGYHSRIGQRGVNLSGGQKQRISLARALVRNPRILILDDCTSAVDTSTEARIKDALNQYTEGLTCLMIAQRITSVMDADRIIVLDDGEIVGIGDHQTLMDECTIYQEIFHSQIGKELETHDKSD